jgi:hypothetical protein
MIHELMENDHEALGELLQSLESSFEEREAMRSFELLDLFWARLAIHIRAENVRLFPAILAARPEVFGTALPPLQEVQSTIQQLRVDHNFFMDELSRAVRRLRQLVKADAYDEPKFASELTRIQSQVNAVSVRLKSHNKVEEDRVYKWPGLAFSQSSLRTLPDLLTRELRNLPPGFSNPAS